MKVNKNEQANSLNRVPINPMNKMPINPIAKMPINPNGLVKHFSNLKNVESNWNAFGFNKKS